MKNMNLYHRVTQILACNPSDSDVYLMVMESFVEGGFRNADLKSLNFVRKYLQAVTLADIATSDGWRISYHSYKGLEGNNLRKDLVWPKVPTRE